MTHGSIFERLWAKSPRSGREAESIAEHTRRAIARIEELRRARIVRLDPGDALWRDLLVACAIHDLGKACAGFQAALRGGAPWRRRHEVASLAFAALVALEDTHSWQRIVAWVATHHESVDVILSRYGSGEGDSETGLEDLAQELPPGVDGEAAVLLDAIGVPPRIRETASTAASRMRRALKGLSEVDAALRQERRFGPSRRSALLGRGLLMLADRLASAHAPALEPLRSVEPDELARRAGIGHWGPHQIAALTAGDRAMLIAPTGTGKTEAALLWALCREPAPWPSSGPLGPLVYLLPYQASLNAMLPRLRRLTGAQVGLLHGHSLDALYQNFRIEAQPEEAEALARRADDLARLYAPPVLLTTPYHLLRAAFRGPGHATLWAGLYGTSIVMDEVHAYEPERMGLIIGLLQALVTDWNARIFVMSATIPPWLSRFLTVHLDLKTIPPPEGVFSRPRHRLRLFGRQSVGSDHSEAWSSFEFLGLAVEAAQAGQNVLVCMNSVRRAVAAWERLRNAWPEHLSVLLHRRLTARDRLQREAELLRRMAGGVRGLVAVTTQVVEVSLDLDFDVGITDIAPPDALAQRLGRVNRRGARPPADIFVVADDDALRVARRVYRQVPSLVLDRTLTWLCARDGDEIGDADVQEGLAFVYCGEVAAQWEAVARRQAQALTEGTLSLLTGLSDDDRAASRFEALFQGTEAVPRGLAGAFETALQQSVLDAMQLLVPVDDWAIGRTRLASFGASGRQVRVRVVDAPYDEVRGLQL